MSPAPVYRNIESQSTLLGLAFPFEVLIVMSVFWGGMLLPLKFHLLAVALTYTFLRLLGARTPPLFLQHRLGFAIRERLHGGVLSASARRARSPVFPFGPYLVRDVQPPSLPPAAQEATAQLATNPPHTPPNSPPEHPNA